MNHGSQIKRNNKNFLFFFIFIIFTFYSSIASSVTILGALNKVSGKISKIKIEDNKETYFDKEEIKIFSGWMFSSSPSISALDHAVYDVWVIDCMSSYIED